MANVRFSENGGFVSVEIEVALDGADTGDHEFRVSSNEGMLWEGNGVKVSVASQDQLPAVTLSNDTNEIIVEWDGSEIGRHTLGDETKSMTAKYEIA